MDSLPNEILVEIFLQCLPDRIREPALESEDYTFSPTPEEAPLLLCSVCSLWREIVIHMPALWRSILVTIDPCSGITRPPIDSLHLWFERSGSEPLWLALHDNSYRFSFSLLPANSSLADQVLAIFNLHISRWHILEINLPNTPLSKEFDTLPETAAPLLRRVDLNINEPVDGFPNIGFALSRMLALAPHLQSLTLDHSFNIDFVDTVNVHWESVTHIDLQGGVLSAAALAQLLAACHQLVSIRVEEIGMENSLIPTTFSPLTLDHLRSMYLYTWVELGGLFDKLTLPVLETLEMSFDPSSSHSWSNTRVASLLNNRSTRRLTKVELHDAQILEEDLIVLLRACPLLQELVIQSEIPCRSVQDQILTLLVASMDGASKSEADEMRFSYLTYLCPCLHTIVWINCVYASDGLLSKMVASRRPETESAPLPPYLQAYLGAIDIGFPGRHIHNHQEDREAFRVLREDGLDVRIL